MSCKNCDLKPICNIYQDVQKHSAYANILILDCAFNKKPIESVKQQVVQPKVVDPFTGKPKVDRDKITELSNKNREEKERKMKEQKIIEEKPMPKFTAEPLVLDHTCETCGATTFKDDISHCNECGKTICSCCATIDGDTHKLLCQECWEKL